MNLNYFMFVDLIVFLFLASNSKEVHAALLEEVEEALVVSDLLSSVQQRVLLLFGEGVSALVVLNIVHDMVDTVLVSREQGGGHNGVQAGHVGLDGGLVEVKVFVHPPNGLEHTGIIGIFLLNPAHDLVIAVALLIVTVELDPLNSFPHGGCAAEAAIEGVTEFGVKG